MREKLSQVANDKVEPFVGKKIKKQIAMLLESKKEEILKKYPVNEFSIEWLGEEETPLDVVFHHEFSVE